MSYILDALKKSERERRDDTLPDPLASGGLGLRRRRASVWPLVALVIGVGALASGLTFWWLGYNRVEVSDPVAAGAPAHSAPPTQMDPPEPGPRSQLSAESARSSRTQAPLFVAAPHDRPTPETRQPVPDTTDTRTVGQVAPLASDRPLLIEPGKAPRYLDTAPSTASPPAVGQSPSSTSDPDDQAPLLSELPLSFQRRVPDLAFNSHIYSPDPGACRVMINNVYLKPGQMVAGMRLVSVTEDGVILSLDGTRFRVPVVRNWVRPE